MEEKKSEQFRKGKTSGGHLLHLLLTAGQTLKLHEVAQGPVTLTFRPPLVPRSIGKLEVYLPVLPGLSPVLAVTGCFVRFIIYFCAESVGKLFCTAPPLFTKEVLFAEVFTKVFIIAGKREEAELQLSQHILLMVYVYSSLHLSKKNQLLRLVFISRQVFQLKPFLCSLHIHLNA